MFSLFLSDAQVSTYKMWDLFIALSPVFCQIIYCKSLCPDSWIKCLLTWGLIASLAVVSQPPTQGRAAKNLLLPLCEACRASWAGETSHRKNTWFWLSLAFCLLAQPYEQACVNSVTYIGTTERWVDLKILSWCEFRQMLNLLI